MVPPDSRAEVVLRCKDAEVASWPLVCGPNVDLTVVDQVARLQLRALRQGCTIWLRDACPELVDLLRFVGLGAVLQVGGKAEEPKEGRVEEAVVADDPVA